MSTEAPVVLVTGGALRIGAEICRHLHRAGFRLALHFNRSELPAKALADEFNRARADSCALFGADLAQANAAQTLAGRVLDHFNQLDLLVNNASVYYKTPLQQSSEQDWDLLLAANLRAPWELCRQLAETLGHNAGAIVNILDAHADRGTPGYALYDMSKNGLQSLTRSLARELAPHVRVNAIAPGIILWPETRDEPLTTAQQDALLNTIPLCA
jgi:pteridine reductase